MKFITVEDIEHITFALARERLGFDEPIPTFKTRYPNVLESCLYSPFQTYNKKSLYPTFVDKVSILFYFMVKNHPFVNGNKRIAMTTLLYVLYREGKWLRVDTQVLYNFAKMVAEAPSDAKEYTVGYVKFFLRKHIVTLKKKDK